MKARCAWCQQEGRRGLLGDRPPFDDATETHGICAWHRDRVLAQLPSRSFPGVEVLIVVARGHPALYDQLCQSFGRTRGVQVIVDRRRGDRRQRNAPVAVEGRREQRRMRRADISALGYTIIRFGKAPAQPVHQSFPG